MSMFKIQEMRCYVIFKIDSSLTKKGNQVRIKAQSISLRACLYIFELSYRPASQPADL